MKIRYFLFLLLFLILFGSCNQDDPKPETGPTRTVLVYMVASNLGDYLNANVEDMIEVANSQNLNGGNLVVYYSKNKNEAELFEIKETGDGVATRYHIRDYINESALSPDVMRGVINEVVSRYPADSYGMILSSHGSAWMPFGYHNMLRSFGDEDRTRAMEIYELAEALPDNLFEFLLFDACSMGSIECVYELRNKADYIVSSASETMAKGFPYKEILPLLFKERANLKGVAESFYHFYQNYTYPFGNISVVKTDELAELAGIVSEILKTAGEEEMFSLPLNEIQTLTYLSGAPTRLYDFGDVLEHLATADQFSRFKISLDKVVSCAYFTDRIYCQGVGGNSGIPVTKFSGLSVYPLQRNLTEMNNWYAQLDWYNAVYKN